MVGELRQQAIRMAGLRVALILGSTAARSSCASRSGCSSWRPQADHDARRCENAATEATPRRHPGKALVLADRRQRQIEGGRAKSITGLAEQEGVTDAYACRLLRVAAEGVRLAEVLENGHVAGSEVQCVSLPATKRDIVKG